VLNRRHILLTSGATALPAVGPSALAQTPAQLKIGFVYLGPIAKSVNPKITAKSVWINSWYDPTIKSAKPRKP
jgi:hypothetical protein